MNVRFIVELTDTDRKPYQLLDEIRIPVRAKPGQVARIDYEYPGTTRGGGGTRSAGSAGSAGSASCAAADASTIQQPHTPSKRPPVRAPRVRKLRMPPAHQLHAPGDIPMPPGRAPQTHRGARQRSRLNARADSEASTASSSTGSTGLDT